MTSTLTFQNNDNNNRNTMVKIIWVGEFTCVTATIHVKFTLYETFPGFKHYLLCLNSGQRQCMLNTLQYNDWRKVFNALNDYYLYARDSGLHLTNVNWSVDASFELLNTRNNNNKCFQWRWGQELHVINLLGKNYNPFAAIFNDHLFLSVPRHRNSKPEIVFSESFTDTEKYCNLSKCIRFICRKQQLEIKLLIYKRNGICVNNFCKIELIDISDEVSSCDRQLFLSFLRYPCIAHQLLMCFQKHDKNCMIDYCDVIPYFELNDFSWSLETNMLTLHLDNNTTHFNINVVSLDVHEKDEKEEEKEEKEQEEKEINESTTATTIATENEKNNEENKDQDDDLIIVDVPCEMAASSEKTPANFMTEMNTPSAVAGQGVDETNDEFRVEKLDIRDDGAYKKMLFRSRIEITTLFYNLMGKCYINTTTDGPNFCVVSILLNNTEVMQHFQISGNDVINQLAACYYFNTRNSGYLVPNCLEKYKHNYAFPQYERAKDRIIEYNLHFMVNNGNEPIVIPVVEKLKKTSTPVTNTPVTSVEQGINETNDKFRIEKLDNCSFNFGDKFSIKSRYDMTGKLSPYINGRVLLTESANNSNECVVQFCENHSTVFSNFLISGNDIFKQLVACCQDAVFCHVPEKYKNNNVRPLCIFSNSTSESSSGADKYVTHFNLQFMVNNGVDALVINLIEPSFNRGKEEKKEKEQGVNKTNDEFRVIVIDQPDAVTEQNKSVGYKSSRFFLDILIAPRENEPNICYLEIINTRGKANHNHFMIQGKDIYNQLKSCLDCDLVGANYNDNHLLIATKAEQVKQGSFELVLQFLVNNGSNRISIPLQMQTGDSLGSFLAHEDRFEVIQCNKIEEEWIPKNRQIASTMCRPIANWMFLMMANANLCILKVESGTIPIHDYYMICGNDAFNQLKACLRHGEVPENYKQNGIEIHNDEFHFVVNNGSRHILIPKSMQETTREINATMATTTIVSDLPCNNDSKVVKEAAVHKAINEKGHLFEVISSCQFGILGKKMKTILVSDLFQPHVNWVFVCEIADDPNVCCLRIDNKFNYLKYFVIRGNDIFNQIKACLGRGVIPEKYQRNSAKWSLNQFPGKLMAVHLDFMVNNGTDCLSIPTTIPPPLPETTTETAREINTAIVSDLPYNDRFEVTMCLPSNCPVHFVTFEMFEAYQIVIGVAGSSKGKDVCYIKVDNRKDDKPTYFMVRGNDILNQIVSCLDPDRDSAPEKYKQNYAETYYRRYPEVDGSRFVASGQLHFYVNNGTKCIRLDDPISPLFSLNENCNMMTKLQAVNASNDPTRALYYNPSSVAGHKLILMNDNGLSTIERFHLDKPLHEYGEFVILPQNGVWYHALEDKDRLVRLSSEASREASRESSREAEEKATTDKWIELGCVDKTKKLALFWNESLKRLRLQKASNGFVLSDVETTMTPEQASIFRGQNLLVIHFSCRDISISYGMVFAKFTDFVLEPTDANDKHLYQTKFPKDGDLLTIHIRPNNMFQVVTTGLCLNLLLSTYAVSINKAGHYVLTRTNDQSKDTSSGDCWSEVKA